MGIVTVPYLVNQTLSLFTHGSETIKQHTDFKAAVGEPFDLKFGDSHNPQNYALHFAMILIDDANMMMFPPDLAKFAKLQVVEQSYIFDMDSVSRTYTNRELEVERCTDEYMAGMGEGVFDIVPMQ